MVSNRQIILSGGALNDAAQSVGLDTIAEGIEDEDQLRFLNERGCQAYQGYFFSRPVTAEKAAEFLSLVPSE